MKRTAVLVAILLALALWLAPPVAAQDTAKFKVSSSPAGAMFKVDGMEFRSEVTFDWPIGTKHVLEFPVSSDGYQYTPLFGSRFAFTGWADDKGLLANGGATAQVVTASADVTGYTLQVAATHRVRFVWVDGVAAFPGGPPSTSPAVCGAPGDPIPLEHRVGVIYVDGVCYWNNVDVWLTDGEHVLNAIPYPGFVFLGWKADVNPSEAFLRRMNVLGPMTVSPRFSPGKRVNFRTDPPGLQVRVDNTSVRTSELDPCRPEDVLPPGAPLTIRPPCIGEFDFALGSPHKIGAPSPQLNAHGRAYVFTGFSNGMGQDATYVTANVVYPEDSLTARFVRGATVSITTRPPGLKIGVDGQEKSENYYVYAPASKHTLSAPSEQTDARGRRYGFKSWGHGGAREQEFTVPETAVETGLRFEAEYELLGQLNITSRTEGASVLVDGEKCILPCAVDRRPGSTVRIEAPAVIAINDRHRAEFVSWSDGGPRARALTIGSTAALSVEAVFRSTFLLTLAADPHEGGRIVTTPAGSDGFFASGTRVNLDVEEASGWRFRRWDYDAQGASRPAFVVMNGPKGVAARFDRVTPAVQLTIRSAAGETPSAGLAPGSLISILGTNLAPEFRAGPTGPILAQVLAGVSVTIGDRILPLIFVSPDQINAQLPRDLTPGEHEIRVLRAGFHDQTGKLTVQRVAPGLFTRTWDGQQIAMAVHEDGTAVTALAPAKPGELITLVGTGFGPYRLAILEGYALPSIPGYPLDSEATVRMGHHQVTPEWAGGLPGQAGADGVRIRIPSGSLGSQPVAVTVDGQPSNTVLLVVESPAA